MSSTSNEVCELWNGQEVVRVMGKGPIREFIIMTPKPYDTFLDLIGDIDKTQVLMDNDGYLEEHS
jgi:hypothetical protein